MWNVNQRIDMSSFIKFMAEENVRVYALIGEKEWGDEEDGAILSVPCILTHWENGIILKKRTMRS